MSVSQQTRGAQEALPLTLSEAQQPAVYFREGVMLVDAGPGSGKTRVVSARVAHLIRRGVPLSQIICLTFSNGAREEMRARIEQVAGASPMVESFHSWARKILVDHEKALHRKVTFTIVDERAQRRAVQAAAKAEGAGEPETVDKLLSAISAAKSRGEATSAQFRRPAKMEAEWADLVRRVWMRYEQWCLTGVRDRGRPARGLDFDDLLNEAAAILRTEVDVRRRYHEEWRHILVDEFQDSNAVQYAMVRMVFENRPSPGQGARYEGEAAGRSLVVVADADQAIYGFRGGVPGIVVGLPGDYPGLVPAPLGENYRSTGHIVLAAAGVIERNRERTVKSLTPTKGPGHKVRVWSVATEAGEAEYVAARCADLWREKAGSAKIAVLTRNRKLHEPLAQALAAQAVPAVRDGGVSLGRTPEVAQMRALLRLAVLPHDDDMVTRLLAGTARAEVAQAAREASACNLSMWEALAHSDNEQVISMRRAVGRIRDALTEGRLARAFAIAFDQTNWVDRLFRDSSAEAQDRLRALSRMVSSVITLHQGDKLRRLRDVLAVLDERVSPVRIMTAHAAKGLEWDYVFICGADEERWRILDEDDAEEERRLFYVAMTRARKGLVISHLRDCPVRFVGEIPAEHATVQEVGAPLEAQETVSAVGFAG